MVPLRNQRSHNPELPRCRVLSCGPVIVAANGQLVVRAVPADPEVAGGKPKRIGTGDHRRVVVGPGLAADVGERPGEKLAAILCGLALERIPIK